MPLVDHDHSRKLLHNPLQQLYTHAHIRTYSSFCTIKVVLLQWRGWVRGLSPTIPPSHLLVPNLSEPKLHPATRHSPSSPSFGFVFGCYLWHRWSQLGKFERQREAMLTTMPPSKQLVLEAKAARRQADALLLSYVDLCPA